MSTKSIMKKAANSLDPSLFEFAQYDEDQAELTGYSSYSFWKSTIQVFMKNKVAVILLIIVCLLVLFTIIQPYIPGQKEPNKIYINDSTGMQLRNQTPNSEYLFGTNSIGQDLWSRIWSGTRTSLFIGFAVGIFEAFAGITIGALWCYVRKLDAVITEIYNVWDNIPSTVVLIILTYIMKPSIPTKKFYMWIAGWV